jgi:hypothetical protein
MQAYGGNEGTVPRILNLDNRQWWAVTLKPRFTSWVSAPGLLTKEESQGGSQGRSERYHRTVRCTVPTEIRTLIRRSSWQQPSL